MPSEVVETRTRVREALIGFADSPLREAGLRLLSALGYASRKTLKLDGSAATFLAAIPDGEALRTKPGAMTARWQRVEFLFQLSNDEIPSLAQGQQDITFGAGDYRRSVIDSFVFLALELEDGEWTRGDLARITREINRAFPMPVVILFRYRRLLSLAVIDRRQDKRDASRAVVERRISIVKDVALDNPHRAQVDTLCDITLSRPRLRGRGAPTNFRELYESWMEALSVQTLNQRFYKDLANWFFWSVKEVTFPAAARATGAERQTQNQIAVIRLLTRLIFVWFIKEKGLVPNALFEPAQLRMLLTEDPITHPDSGTFYKAILQNLFFATLNTEMSDGRRWRTKAVAGGLDGQYLIPNVYRYRAAFADPERALDLFKETPFLNGGLFESLDRELSDRDLKRNPALAKQATKEGSHLVLRIDGFSERADNPLIVPNKLFFAEDEAVDLNADYETRGRSYQASGLIELFSRYKFTVEENTPVEEEVALDPELLGKVFENLLASYNEDTRTTARKKSGSFYTPREVVDYMVDEALVAYFEPRLADVPAPQSRKAHSRSLDLGAARGELELASAPPAPASTSTAVAPDDRLRELLSFKGTDNPFSAAETGTLIAAIDSLRALDPACGSGAFPMGLLQKLIHILHRLDPGNARWKAQNRRPLEMRLEAAKSTPDPARRETEIGEAEAALEKLDHDFSDANRPDYARKLYLIDKCLFGVDIQPIAVQIAKLRFFISLVVSQKIDRTQDNANITALPNLETKLVAANSLIPIERPAQVDLFRNKAIEAKEGELRDMNARYFGARTMKTKRSRRDAIGALRDELADLLQTERGLPEAEARKMAAWDPFDQNSAAGFFDPEWMFGLSARFDLVIGNPPYVRQEAIKDQKPELEKFYGGKDANGNPIGAYSGTADLFVYFVQRGIELLNPGGAFAYITSNKWYRAKYGERLRSWLSRHARLCRIIDFGDAEVFDALAYPTIVIASRRETPVQVAPEGDILRVLNWPADRDKSEVEGFPALVHSLGFDMPQKALAGGGWQLEPQTQRVLLDRIRAGGTPLGQYVEGRFYYGVKTGLNEAFVVDGPTKDRLIAEDASSREILKPFLRGRDIKRWRVEPQDLWLIFTRRGIEIDHYPAIKRFLEPHRGALTPKPSTWNDRRNGVWRGRKSGSYEWYEIQDNVAYWPQFEHPKILVPEIQQSAQYALDYAGFYCVNKASFVVSDDILFLSGILNSPVSFWITKNTFASKQGGFFEFTQQYVSKIPIPKVDRTPKRLIEATVKSILTVERTGPLEQLLNGFVYELFFRDDLHARGLTVFDEAEGADLGKLADLDGTALVIAAAAFATTHLAPGARLHTMLQDLRSLDVVRIIEGSA